LEQAFFITELMPSPFPGMNPYLESQHWQGVHHLLIAELARYLNANLPSTYYAAVEVRIYETIDADDSEAKATLVGIPDNIVVQAEHLPESPSRSPLATIAKPVMVMVPIVEEVEEGYLEIREVDTHEVITALELLSPKNKQPGKGRKKYEEKRQQILSSGTHLVELDLIRRFRAMEFSGAFVDSDYRILVSRSPQRPRAELYKFNLSDAIPVFPVPLRSQHADVAIDLKLLLDNIYDVGAYSRQINYTQEPPEPKLSEDDRLWCDQILKNQGLRTVS
jgi:hypothetical protein